MASAPEIPSPVKSFETQWYHEVQPNMRLVESGEMWSSMAVSEASRDPLKLTTPLFLLWVVS
jgi:hypothetical protein